ncbi:MAG: hypothetical protein M1138_00945 [Candidatus Thermoplasmatota archaeon]|nr:hypothetical protein [Candidatus Thermoplasmatota archaeon]
MMVRDEADLPVGIHTTISKRIYDMVPKDTRWKDLLEEIILAKFGNAEEVEIANLQKKIEDLQLEMARARIELEAKIQQKKRDEELRKALRIEEKYAVRAFRHLIGILIKARSSRKSMGMKLEVIEKRWGITFDRERLNSEYEDFLIEFEAGLLSDDEILRRYSVKKVNVGAELEPEIKAQIEAELGLS